MSEEFESDVVEEAVVDDSPVEETSYEEPSSPDPEPEGLDLSEVFDEVSESSVTGGYDSDPAPETNPFVDQVRGAGLDAESLEDAQNVLLQSYQQAQDYSRQQAYHQQMQQQAWQQQQAQQAAQMQQMQQMAQAGQHFQQLAGDEDFRDWVQQRAEQENNPTTDTWWSPPAINEQEMQQWRTPVQTRNGVQWGWKHGTPKDLIQRADDYIKYHDKWSEDLTRRPQEVLPRIIEEEFDKLFIDRYGSLLEQAKQHQEDQAKDQHIRSINERNADWVYQRDPTTGQQRRDQTGRLQLTPEGQQVIGYINQLRQGGMQDPDQLWQTATQMLAGRMASSRLGEMQQQMAAQQSGQDRNVRHLQRGAGYIPNRGGSVAPPENPSPNSQNQHLSAGDKLRQQALSDGLF